MSGKRPAKKRRPWLRALIAVCVVLIAAPPFWWWQNETVQTEEFELVSDSLPAAFDGLRVAVVADVHGRVLGEGNSRLLEAVRESAPDIISINGDLIDQISEMEMVTPLISGLVEIAPVFYVTGNHEWAVGNVGELVELLESLGVTVLQNEYILLTRGDESIAIAGVHDPNGPADMTTPEQLVSRMRESWDGYALMLAHRNNQLRQWSTLGVDAVIAAHGHGGIIRLPLLGGLVGTDRTLFPQYTEGVYKMGATSMLVSRGLGNSGVEFRLFNRPQLAVAVLRCA